MARLLARVVDVVDEATGTVRLKRKVDAAAEMALDTRSTQDGPGQEGLAVATCPSGHESASGDFCDVCGVLIGAAPSLGPGLDPDAGAAAGSGMAGGRAADGTEAGGTVIGAPPRWSSPARAAVPRATASSASRAAITSRPPQATPASRQPVPPPPGPAPAAPDAQVPGAYASRRSGHGPQATFDPARPFPCRQAPCPAAPRRLGGAGRRGVDRRGERGPRLLRHGPGGGRPGLGRHRVSRLQPAAALPARPGRDPDRQAQRVKRHLPGDRPVCTARPTRAYPGCTRSCCAPRTGAGPSSIPAQRTGPCSTAPSSPPARSSPCTTVTGSTWAPGPNCGSPAAPSGTQGERQMTCQ